MSLSWWRQLVLDAWYSRFSWLSLALIPFSFIYGSLTLSSRRWYLHKAPPGVVTWFPVPVIVVGNLTVGGTGKTPLVAWIAKFLQQQGYHPGIVSRGYGGTSKTWPQIVRPDSDPFVVGDEAVLLARQTACPVAVDPVRPAAVECLLKQYRCDVIISDDGLQHYTLGRQIEIVVIDGERRFGNKRCLPAGPLREPMLRLHTVDFVVVNGEGQKGEVPMQLIPGKIYNVQSPEVTITPEELSDEALHAIAGIGNPERFFQQLRALKLIIWPHRFADHHSFTASDIKFDDDARVIMTEKDAVKCEKFADYRYWCLPVTAELPPPFSEELLKRVRYYSEAIKQRVKQKN